MLSEGKVEEAIQSILLNNQVCKHSIKLLPGNPKILEICLDSKENKVDLNYCEKVSREISDCLDLIDGEDDNYLLDVCSFGIEQVLENDDDINNNIGQWVHLDFVNSIHNKECVEGTLLSYHDNQMTIEYFDKNIKKKLEVLKENVKLIRLAVKL